MRTVVWVPYRGDGPEGWRTRNFEIVLPFIESLGYEVFIADSGHKPFSIANTWNLLASQSGDWDRAIRWGADLLIQSPESVYRAVSESTKPGHHYVHAFDRVSKLNEDETRIIHQGGQPILKRSRVPFGGVSVITRELWETVGGYDSRFLGWGHEDRAFVHCIEMLVGPRTRVSGRMINLWHPKREDAPKDPYFMNQDKNHRMLEEYQSIKNPAALKRYLEILRSRASDSTILVEPSTIEIST